MESQKIKQRKESEDDFDDSPTGSMSTMLVDRDEIEDEFFDFKAIDAIIESSGRILKDIQNKYSYLSKNDIKKVTISLNEALSDVFPILEHIDERILEGIIFAKERKASNLIPILQAVQEHFGYLSKITIKRIGEYLELSINEVYSVATFYTQFKFEMPGDHQITLCSGTACFVKGGNILLDAAEKFLKIKAGETSKDRMFTLETVACMGCCALAPAVKIDDEIHGHLKPAKLVKLLKKTRKGGS